MTASRVVSREDWLLARRAFLEKEKAFTKAREDIARERRELPWMRIDKAYSFEGPDLTSKGRDESGLPWPMAWVRRHDQY